MDDFSGNVYTQEEVDQLISLVADVSSGLMDSVSLYEGTPPFEELSEAVEKAIELLIYMSSVFAGLNAGIVKQREQMLALKNELEQQRAWIVRN